MKQQLNILNPPSHKVTLTLFLSILCFSVFSQEPEVKATEETINYRFSPQGDKLEVIESISSNFENLESNVTFGKIEFFDNQSIITETSVRNQKGKRLKISAKEYQYPVEDYFYSDASVSLVEVPFGEEGTRRTIEVKKKYLDIRYFTRVSFFSYYPIDEKKISFEVPSTVDVELVKFNFEGYDIEEEIQEKEEGTIITYTLKNLKEYVGENRSYGSLRNLPHLLVVPKSYTYKNENHKIFETTDDLYTWYSSIIDLVENDNQTIKEITSRLTKGLTTDEEKIKALYYWVQDNIRYIAFEDGIAGFKPDEAQNVYTKKYGDCKGMANLLKEMLIEAGYDARLSWIGTNRLPYSYDTPSLGVDNHMITTVYLNNEPIFLDPTDTYCPFGEVGFHIQGKEVMIQDGDNYSIDKIPTRDYTQNLEEITLNYELTENLELKGDATHIYNGLSKTFLLHIINSIEQNDIEDAVTHFLDNGDKNISVSDIEYGSIKQREGVFNIQYNIQVNNHVSKFGDELYIDLDFEEEFYKMDFEDDRMTDYVFPHQVNRVVNHELVFPQNYTVSHLPETVNIKNEYFTITAGFSHLANKIVYTKNIQVKDGIIPTTAFEEWNNVIQQLDNFYEDSIILQPK